MRCSLIFLQYFANFFVSCFLIDYVKTLIINEGLINKIKHSRGEQNIPLQWEFQRVKGPFTLARFFL